MLYLYGPAPGCRKAQLKGSPTSSPSLYLLPAGWPLIMSLEKWIARFRGGKEDNVHLPTGKELTTCRRNCTQKHLLQLLRSVLHAIDKDLLLNPSHAPDMVNVLYRQLAKDDHADPCITSVAWGGVAGLIVLYFDRFIRLDMTPKLRQASLVDGPETMTPIELADAWSGFEDSVIHDVEDELITWGNLYGLPPGDASIRRRYFISVYEEAGCKELLSTSADWIKFRQFIKEHGKLSKHVEFWLTGGVATYLHGMLTGCFGKRTQLIQEEAWKTADWLLGRRSTPPEKL